MKIRPNLGNDHYYGYDGQNPHATARNAALPQKSTYVLPPKRTIAALYQARAYSTPDFARPFKFFGSFEGLFQG